MNNELNNTAGFRYSVAASPYSLPAAPVLLQSADINLIAGQAKIIGYDGIELHLRSPEDLDLGDVLNACANASISVSAVASGLAFVRDGLCLIDPDQTIRRKAIQRLLSFIDWVAPLNAGLIVGSMRGNLPLDDSSKYFNYYTEAIRELAAYAESKSVNLLIECINRYENNYINTAEECLSFLDLIDSPSVKMHLDTFHMNIEESNMLKAISLAADTLGYFHVADNTRQACGTGSIDFKPILTALEEINYDGFVTVECLPGSSGVETARFSLAHLRKENK